VIDGGSTAMEMLRNGYLILGASRKRYFDLAAYLNVSQSGSSIKTTNNTITISSAQHRSRNPNALSTMTPPTLLPRLLAALLACASAAAHHIHIFDAHHAGPASHGAPLPSTVSPATARLILAARLDLGAHIAVGGGVDDAGLAAVNALGGFAASPLAGRSRPTGHGEDERRGLVVVQGVDRPEDVLPRDMQRWRSFSVSSVPHKERTEELVAELEAAMEDAAMKEFGFAPPKIDADKEPWLWHINGRGIYHKKRLGVSICVDGTRNEANGGSASGRSSGPTAGSTRRRRPGSG
jgi:hypothetical protein